MRRLIFVFAAMFVAVSADAQIEWTRKYATTVVRGHVTNRPEEFDKVVTYMYHDIADVVKNQRETDDLLAVTDSAGYFTIKCKICWPLAFSADLCKVRATNVGRPLVCPGDTIEVELDYKKAQELGNDTERILKEAMTVKGGTFQRSADYIILCKELCDKMNRYKPAELLENCRNNFPAYQQLLWDLHQQNLKTMKKTKLSKDEKIMLEYALECSYINAYKSYVGRMKSAGIDSLELIRAERDFTLKDPHAAELKCPHTINSVFYLNPKCLDYLQANDLGELPLGQYLQERVKVREMVTRLQAQQNVPSEEIEKLSPEFQQPLYELKAQIADNLMSSGAGWQPTGDQATWLQQIADHYKGKVVLIDYWATWCGPCQLGIREMEKVKADYEKKGVQFVYITDESSSNEGYLQMKKSHSGDHFIFTKADIAKMNLPEFRHAIPYYIIYSRDAKFVKALTGWENLPFMMNELDRALAK